MNTEKEENFFKKFIISIKDFEKYPELATKKIGIVISYLIKLLAIFTIIISIIYVIKISDNIKNTISYLNEKIPEFKLENNILELEINDAIIIENLEGDIFNTIIIDTNDIHQEISNDYKEKISKVPNGILFLKDKLYIKTEKINELIEYTYSNISETYKIDNFNKQQFTQYFTGKNLVILCIAIFIITFIYIFLVYITSIWLDILLLAGFGYITSIFMRIRIRFIAICKIAIHSLTLPILLNAIVVAIETFTQFKIKYFEIMYMGIACVYIVAAIMMIKADIIKHQEELNKIIEEQAKVKEELEKREEENKQNEEIEKEKQKKKEEKEQEKKNKNGSNKDNKEPQGQNT